MRSLSIVGLLLAMLGAVGLVFAHAIFATGWLGIAVQVAAALLMAWARWTFRARSFHATAEPTAGGLVTSGPYHFVRHPIYAALIYFLWAGALSHPQALPLALAALATVGLALRMYAEETLVVQQYPEYAAYAARTWRVFPGQLVMRPAGRLDPPI
jgi:protein-S-isoprenylcysteine O-methyltransferase Ste14